MLRRSVLLVVTCAVSAPNAARADRTGDEAIALALFNEAKQLSADGAHAAACPKYAAADRLTGWLGVELNLADCYEHIGRTASAWVVWRKAAAKAEADHDDRLDYARARAAALEPSLAHVSIRAAHDVVVEIDDVVLAAGELGTALPIDPGDHVVSGRHGTSHVWSQRFSVPAGGSAVVTIPVLAIPDAPPPSRPMPEPRSRWVAWSVGGAGVAMLGATAWLGLSAKRTYDRATSEHCTAALECDSYGLRRIDDARTRGTIATITGVAGLAAVTTAAVLLFRARRDDQPSVSVAPAVSPNAIGVTVEGAL